MTRQRLTNRHYHTIGYIDTAPDGKQTALDAHFHTVGHFAPHTNRTSDAHYRTVGQGNLLASLIVDK